VDFSKPEIFVFCPLIMLTGGFFEKLFVRSKEPIAVTVTVVESSFGNECGC